MGKVIYREVTSENTVETEFELLEDFIAWEKLKNTTEAGAISNTIDIRIFYDLNAKEIEDSFIKHKKNPPPEMVMCILLTNMGTSHLKVVGKVLMRDFSGGL